MSARLSAFGAWILLGIGGVVIVRTAHAQSGNVWDGVYVGVNAGAAHGSTCNQWTPGGSGSDAPLTNNDCVGSAVVGGFQIGDNMQYGRVAWGLGADIDVWHATNSNSAVTYSGGSVPHGNYVFSDRVAPKGFALLGPRIGYAGNQWMPYLRAGAMVPFGKHDNTLYYRPTGAANSTASFDGGKSFSSAGWAAGAGAEWGLKGAWSISAEYLHASFGKASGAVAGCGGTAANCAAFSGISFGDVHDASHANILRIGISYWFSYWNI
jgi:outer membrane immunogenic protein